MSADVIPAYWDENSPGRPGVYRLEREGFQDRRKWTSNLVRGMVADGHGFTVYRAGSGRRRGTGRAPSWYTPPHPVELAQEDGECAGERAKRSRRGRPQDAELRAAWDAGFLSFAAARIFSALHGRPALEAWRGPYTCKEVLRAVAGLDASPDERAAFEAVRKWLDDKPARRGRPRKIGRPTKAAAAKRRQRAARAAAQAEAQQ